MVILSAAVIIEGIIVAISSGILIKLICTNFQKIKRTIILAIKLIKKKQMYEKGTVFEGGVPIFKSPYGYLYDMSGDKKIFFCADCYNAKHVRLVKTGCKKYVCPVCNKEYKAK